MEKIPSDSPRKFPYQDRVWGGSDDETAAEAEPGRSAMAEPDAVSDASDSDSEASNDEDGWSCDEEHGEVAYE